MASQTEPSPRRSDTSQTTTVHDNDGTMTETSEKQVQQPERDLEANKPSATGPNKTPKDPDLVTWDGPEDPANPKNWSTRAKWGLTVLISTFTFLSPISSSMVAPALGQLGDELGMQSDIEIEMALSIFILGYAVGPLFFGPVSELYGRKRVVLVSNFFYLAWNLGCGFAQNKAEMFVFRLLAGIGGSAPLAIGGGALR